MNEELIRQYTREAYRSAYGRDNPPYNVIGKFAKALLELHHARAVAPLERENAELRALVAELTEQTKRDGERIGQLEAKVAPLVAAATEARRIAMEQAVKARVPECGNFGEIAQDLDAALAPFRKEAKK